MNAFSTNRKTIATALVQTCCSSAEPQKEKAYSEERQAGPAGVVENCLTVRLLVSGTGTLSAELLGLHLAVVGNEEGTVVGDKGLLELVLGVLVDELLVVGDLWGEKGATW